MKKVGEYWVPDQETIQIEALSKGPWQIDHLKAAMFHVKHFGTAIDGGAHIGSWTRAMARRFDKVVAFEPSQETHDCLLRNTEDLFNVERLRCALGEVEGKLEMGEDGKYSDGGNTGGRYLVERGAPGASLPPVRVRTLDSFGYERVDFLKLDVEGFEYFAILGGKETIKRCRPVVMLEVKHRMAARYGLRADAAGHLLDVMGMKHLGHTGSDHVWGWE